MKTPKKILIIQLRRVGDVVFTLPVLRILRENFPSAQIDFLVEKPSDQLVSLNPYVSRVLTYDRRRSFSWIREVRSERYDWVLDFHSNGRTLWLTFFSGASVRAGFDGPVTRRLVYNRRFKTSDRKYLVEQKLDILRQLGLDAGSWSWDLQVPAPEMKWAEQFLKENGIGPNEKIVGIAPATRRPIRTWIAERFSEVARNMVRDSHPVLFLWGLGEKDFIDGIVKDVGPGKVIVPPNTSLLQLAALIAKCSAVLAVDNGPKNMAVALGVPTATLSGPTNPLSFNPHEDPSHVLIRDEKLFCIACGLNACPYKHECMENIRVETVTRKLRELLNSRKVVA